MKQLVVVRNVKRAGRTNSRRVVKLVLLFILFVFTISSSVSSVAKAYRVKQEQYKEMRFLEEELKRLKQRNAEQRKQIKNLYKDEYIEMFARERFGLIKPGEKAYIVILPQKEEKK